MTCLCTCRSAPDQPCPCHAVNIVLLDEPNEDSVEGLINKMAQVAMRRQYLGKAGDIRRLARKLKEMVIP